MKTIIDAIVVLAILFGGTLGLKKIHDEVRKAALEKASQGLPSLSRFTQKLQK